MLTIDMSSREMYIITKGEAMYFFSDARTDDLLDSVQYELSSGDYDGACDEFIETVEQYYNAGVDTSKDASYSNIIEAQLTPLEKRYKRFSLRYNVYADGRFGRISCQSGRSLRLRQKRQGCEL